MRRWVWLALLRLLGGAVAVVTGPGRTLADRADLFVAKMDPQWLITARTCSEADGQIVTLGPPRQPTMAIVGRTNLPTTSGHVLPVVRLVPHSRRDVVLARLATSVADGAPVRIGSAAPSLGERLRMVGYGRTGTEWVPNQAHTATFEVTSVSASTVDVVGTVAGDRRATVTSVAPLGFAALSMAALAFNTLLVASTTGCCTGWTSPAPTRWRRPPCCCG